MMRSSFAPSVSSVFVGTFCPAFHPAGSPGLFAVVVGAGVAGAGAGTKSHAPLDCFM